MNTDKNYIAKDDFLKDILLILRETFEGSPEGQGSAYLDRGIGFISTIDNLSAEQVSNKIGETTIAAQTEHAKFYLDRLCEFMTGRTEAVKWEQSWLIETVNEVEWNALRDSVKKSYENVLQTFAKIETWNQDNIGDAVAIIAHTAYHLGAIRQLAKSA
ncbi:MAG: DinB family protein [Blastocatellia bacterium]|nr:DinB family protein [Blastocatellia bacterium]